MLIKIMAKWPNGLVVLIVFSTFAWEGTFANYKILSPFLEKYFQIQLDIFNFVKAEEIFDFIKTKPTSFRIFSEQPKTSTLEKKTPAIRIQSVPSSYRKKS